MKADLKHVLGQIGSARGVVVSGAGLMTPIKPMLCRASKTFSDAMKRCKSALIFGEIKCASVVSNRSGLKMIAGFSGT